MKNLRLSTLLLLLTVGFSEIFAQNTNTCPIVSANCFDGGYSFSVDFGTYENASQFANDNLIVIGPNFERSIDLNFSPSSSTQFTIYGINPPINCGNDKITFYVAGQTCIYENGIISVCNSCFPEERFPCPTSFNCESNSNYAALQFEESNQNDPFLVLNPTVNIYGGLNSQINGIHSVLGQEGSGALFVNLGSVEEEECDRLLQMEILGNLCVYENGILLDDNCYPFYEEPNITTETNDLCSSIYQQCLPDFINFLNQEGGNIECKTFHGECDTNGNINRSGKISIGTSKFYPDFQLIVKEGILADRAKIEFCENDGWCDYVFNDDYQLLPLDSLNLYITDLGHLPNIPSAEFVNEQGNFGLRWVITMQQEKIEEAYLYLFSLNNEVDGLLLQLHELETENAKLKNE